MTGGVTVKVKEDKSKLPTAVTPGADGGSILNDTLLIIIVMFKIISTLGSLVRFTFLV